MLQGGRMSTWIKAITTNGALRAVSVQGTDLVREVAQLHHLAGHSALMLGEAVLGALLLVSSSKPGERLNLNVRGSGSILQALVDARPEGSIRGYVVQNPDFDTLISDRPIGPWGEGLVSVLRTRLGFATAPYIGTVPLITGHLAKDLTFYLLQSEQVPSAMAMRVKMKGPEVASAVGILVQAMPDAQPEEIKRVESRIQSLGGFLDSLDASSDPMKLVAQVFQDEPFMKLDERSLIVQCECSMDRVLKSLLLIGREELNHLIHEQGQASVKCDFCSKDYVVSQEKLQELLDQTSAS